MPQVPKTESNFFSGIHYFRGLAILLIVSSHLLYYDESTFFFKVISAVYLNSTIFFAFISGFLFQQLRYKYNYKKYLVKKWVNVILPYLLISIPAILYRLLTGPSYLATLDNVDLEYQSKIYQIVYYYFTGSHLLPLWYLPMISVFFILAPLFNELDAKPKFYWLLPAMFLLSLFLPRGDFRNLSNIPYMCGHFLSVYCFGMFVSRYYMAVFKFVKSRSTVLLISFILLFIATVLLESYRPQLIFLQKILAVLVLLNFLNHLKNKRISSFFSQLADTSFGIYFIHFYFILVFREVFLKLFNNQYPHHPILWVLLFIIVMSCSYGLVYLIKKVFKSKSRYLIGS